MGERVSGLFEVHDEGRLRAEFVLCQVGRDHCAVDGPGAAVVEGESAGDHVQHGVRSTDPAEHVGDDAPDLERIIVLAPCDRGDQHARCQPVREQRPESAAEPERVPGIHIDLVMCPADGLEFSCLPLFLRDRGLLLGGENGALPTSGDGIGPLLVLELTPVGALLDTGAEEHGHQLGGRGPGATQGETLLGGR